MATNYDVFADFYDSLTLNVDYKKRADYIAEVLKKHNHNMGLTLDLACGTGNLTIELKKRGVDIYGIDGCQEMLSQALDKAYDEELSILFLCQKMESIDLYGTIDTCLCTLDSINHITDIDKVQKTFDRVSLFMNPGGCFLFDVNTLYKHRIILGNNTFVYDTDSVYCVWQNTLRENDVVDIDLDFFEENSGAYYRSEQHFSERAYSDAQLTEMLEKAGFRVEAIYGDMTTEIPEENEQRVIYVARKI
jgi:ubiquinone/menaquinone biosynthesis C-methylase UbiE